MIGVFASGLRHVSRAWLLMPLYLSSLALGLVQGWPIWAAGADGLRNPFLAQLAGGSPDALLDLILAQPQLAGERAGQWSLLTLLIAFGSGLVYNLFCGGI
ncbi:MAG TPA: hypothetical protein VFT99_11335, partial [Roseiflexaceae bacterium]|nr:hypothetical protein [Roseiflexaceae bacterium]